MDTETRWLPVVGFPRYAVSDSGEVISWGTQRRTPKAGVYSVLPGKILRPYISTVGYAVVALFKDGRQTPPQLVHRLVASAFLDTDESRRVVNHKNGIKTDNRVENLEWCTPAENCAHAGRTGLAPRGLRHWTASKPERGARGERHGLAKLTESSVLEIKEKALAGITQTALAGKYGVSTGTVAAILNGRTWKHVRGVQDA